MVAVYPEGQRGSRVIEPQSRRSLVDETMEGRFKRCLWHCTTLKIVAIEMPTTWIPNERFSSGHLHHFTESLRRGKI